MHQERLFVERIGVNQMKIDNTFYNNQLGLSCVENHTMAIIKLFQMEIAQLFLESYVSMENAVKYFRVHNVDYSHYTGINRIQDTAKMLNLVDYQSHSMNIDELELFLQNDNCSNVSVLIMADMKKCKVFPIEINAMREEHFLLITDYKDGKYKILDDITRYSTEVTKDELSKFFSGEIISFNKKKEISKENFQAMIQARTMKSFFMGYSEEEIFRNIENADNLEHILSLRDGIGVLRVSRKRMRTVANYLFDTSSSEKGEQLINCLMKQIQEIDQLYSKLEYCRIRKRMNGEYIEKAWMKIMEHEKDWIMLWKSLLS